MRASVQISRGIESLFGTRDENIRLIESGFRINTHLVDNSLELEGAPDDVARAENVLEEYVAHRKSRERQIMRLLAKGPTKISDVVATLYVETPEGLLEMAAHQVHAHLLKLKSEGKVTGAGPKSAWSRV